MLLPNMEGEVTVLACRKAFISEFERRNDCQVSLLNCDSETDFEKKDMPEYLDDQEIKQTRTALYTPRTNGVRKRTLHAAKSYAEQKQFRTGILGRSFIAGSFRQQNNN